MRTIFIIIITVIAFSCNKPKPDSDIFKYNHEEEIFLDYTNSYNDGFIIPSSNSFFEIKFITEDYIGKYYKIYYQNESYKFDDILNLSNENFYGSWSDANIEFKRILEDTTIIKFQIQGNPRNEEKYYQDNRVYFSENQIKKTAESILTDKKWANSILEKSKINNITFEKQLYIDTEWLLIDNKKSKRTNNRWQRNPRLGVYSLLIVIVDPEQLAKIPKYIANISLRNSESHFVNPYKYFVDNEDNSKGLVYKIDNFIKVKAKPPINKGIYVSCKLRDIDTACYNKYVNSSLKLNNNAAFAYFPNKRSIDEPIQHLPVSSKLLSGEYSLEDYKKNIEEFDEQRVEIFFENSKTPGKTVGVNEKNNSIWFKNPANKEGEYKKENIGIQTRNGFTYGKYTFKIKMAELLNKHNVWTGLTNALWLMAESDAEWNKRRICNKGGFLPYYGAPKTEKRIPAVSYSEIDFEIIKAAENWPLTSYKDKTCRKEDPASHVDKVMIACTNFDLACQQPNSFNKGVEKIRYKKDTFNIHRWNTWYHALTSKVPITDDELFQSEFYYFQIEWKPTEIIWRIGKDKKNLKVVGYMNDKVTSIPNNQMVCIITQEYHHSHWWPESPFEQENIPFILEDLKGVLYEIEIE